MYRDAGYEWGVPAELDLAGAVDAWAQLPLLVQPGAEWNYSHATDVVGRIVEVASGQTLDAYFAEHILGPLDMVDTTFRVGGRTRRTGWRRCTHPIPRLARRCRCRRWATLPTTPIGSPAVAG